MKNSRDTAASGVLVVDDDVTNLEILVRSVKESGLKPYPFADSKAAWEFLRREPHAAHIALLDKMMPGMDGLELLGRIKAQKELRDMPVIVQTGDPSVDQMHMGIDGGAFYYLAKPYHTSVLFSLLQAALREVELRDGLRARIKTVVPAALAQQATYLVRTPAEAHDLAAVIGKQFPSPTPVATALCELMLNGIEHGNLEIGFEDKSKLLAAGTWDAELGQRLEDDRYRARQVSVTVEETKTGHQIVVTDEGSGFDVGAYCQDKLSPSRFTGPNGRGIARAMAWLGSRVQYRDKGRTASVHIRRDGKPPRSS
jgi:CheY-like chemotaxis protein